MVLNVVIESNQLLFKARETVQHLALELFGGHHHAFRFLFRLTPASLIAIATACLRLVTLLPELERREP